MVDAPAPPPPAGAPLSLIRNSAVFLAVVTAGAVTIFFREIFSPLVVATFLLLLIDAVSRVLQKRLPRVAGWLRAGVAGLVILAGFGAVIGLLVVEGPPFAVHIQGLAPRLNALLAAISGIAGIPPMTVGQLFEQNDPSRIIIGAFGAARSLVSYSFLVIIYFGFLLASRRAFTRKVGQLFQSNENRQSATRVMRSVRNAVEQYVRLQTVKALLIAACALGLMLIMGVHDALFVSFVVFLTAYVPIVGAIAGSLFPGLVGLAEFPDFVRPALLVGILATLVFLIDNVLMPKLQIDELNIDPMLVLISIGFWGALFGTPGILLSTPLTVSVMAITAEFENTRWLAVLISKDGHPIRGAED